MDLLNRIKESLYSSFLLALCIGAILWFPLNIAIGFVLASTMRVTIMIKRLVIYHALAYCVLGWVYMTETENLLAAACSYCACAGGFAETNCLR